MLTANEAKLIAFINKTRRLFHSVENLIEEAALKGETMCSVKLDDSTGSTIGMLYEISHLLFELGYQTAIEYSSKTLTIYWHVKSPTYYNIDDDFDSIEE